MAFDWHKVTSEVASLAALQGLLKKTDQGHLVCAPFVLPPWRIPQSTYAHLQQLTPLFNTLAWQVAQDRDFLQASLSSATQHDAFLAKLLTLEKITSPDKAAELLITRSDYFFHQPQVAPNAEPSTLVPSALRQVELNTIAAGYAGLSEVWAKVVQHLQPRLGEAFGAVEQTLENIPCTKLAGVLAQAHGCYGKPAAVVVMVVQADDNNAFDQWWLHHALVAQGVHTRRYTLGDIAAQGQLRGGALWMAGEEVALAYFRAAYGPEDFTHHTSWEGREKIARSSTIEVPSLAVQLAGMKRIQQVLTQPNQVERYLPAPHAARVRQTFAAIYDLEAPVADNHSDTTTTSQPAYQAALDNPRRYVLKPMREGGGNNLYDQALHHALKQATRAQRNTWVLMERLQPPSRQVAFFSAGELVTQAGAVSELGCFGALLVQAGRVVCNRDAGWLVRTKQTQQREGGISAGVGFLDSLLLV